jgi:hypothetical protein
VKQPLVQSVEDLTAKGYVVLTAEQAEEVMALLGALAFEGSNRGRLDVLPLRGRAEKLLSEWS